MRESILYNAYIAQDKVRSLMNKYSYKMSLAEQDWFTNLGISEPELFYNLPCQFNRQTSLALLTSDNMPEFFKTHHCDKPRNINIFHRNGCGPTPGSCHNTIPANMSQLYDINIDIDQFWLSVRRKKTFPLLLRDVLYIKCVPPAWQYCLDVYNEIIPINGLPP